MTQNIITILLFLLPGMIALYVEENILGNSGKPKSDLDKTIEAVLLNIPIFAISLALITVANWIWVDYYSGYWWSIKSISDVELWLNSLKHLALYIFCSVLSAIFIGWLWTNQSKATSVYIKFFNHLRKKKGSASKSGYPSVWDRIVNNQEEVVVTLKTKDGEKIKGFLKGFSQSGDKPREITINGFDVVEKFDGFFDDITEVYHNLDTGTILVFHDMTQFKNYLDDARTTSS